MLHWSVSMYSCHMSCFIRYQYASPFARVRPVQLLSKPGSFQATISTSRRCLSMDWLVSQVFGGSEEGYFAVSESEVSDLDQPSKHFGQGQHLEAAAQAHSKQTNQFLMQQSHPHMSLDQALKAHSNASMRSESSASQASKHAALDMAHVQSAPHPALQNFSTPSRYQPPMEPLNVQLMGQALAKHNLHSSQNDHHSMPQNREIEPQLPNFNNLPLLQRLKLCRWLQAGVKQGEIEIDSLPNCPMWLQSSGRLHYTPGHIATDHVQRHSNDVAGSQQPSSGSQMMPINSMPTQGQGRQSNASLLQMLSELQKQPSSAMTTGHSNLPFQTALPARESWQSQAQQSQQMLNVADVQLAMLRQQQQLMMSSTLPM